MESNGSGIKGSGMNINIQDWRLVWFFFKPYRFRGLIVLTFMSLTGFLEMLNLAALYPIINFGLNLGVNNEAIRRFEKLTAYVVPGNPFLASCFLLIVISVLAMGCRYIYSYYGNKLLVRIVGETKKRVFDRLVAADYDYFVTNHQGHLIYAGSAAPERVYAVVMNIVTFAYNLFNALFMFFLLMVLSWKITILILFMAAFYSVVIQNVVRAYIHKCSAVITEESRRRNVVLNEFITGVKTIKVYLAAGDWTNRFRQAVDRSLLSNFRMSMAISNADTFIKLVFYVSLASVGIYLSRKSPAEIMALLPALGTMVMAANRFLPSARTLGNTVVDIVKCLPDLRIVHELCHKTVAAIPDGTLDLGGFRDRITFEDVWFKYDSMNDHLLKGLSFAIEKKKMSALVGLSGSGKTTIINLLLKLYRPVKGSIRIDGVDIGSFSNRTYLAAIGYVAQEPFIFNNSFKENIRFGMADCTDEMVREAAVLANADEFIRETPDGYDSIVGDSGIKLSGGERQRVAIARAMLRRPQILILDEATSSLDNISEKKIQAAINNISKQTTVLVIAHRLSTVQNADKIIILDKGEIVEQGTHEELLNNKNLYYELYTAKDPVEGTVLEGKIG
jgi:ATP-binding cassette, subfamily B, bacterial